MHQTNNISSIQLFSEFFHENQEKFLSFAYSYIR
ncbi:RNA polymerase sigma-70 factor, partial [Bacteroides thetaiotaomicron]